MKVSIAWVCDHLRCNWHDHDIPALISRLSSTIGEIDGFEQVMVPVNEFFLAEVESCGAEDLLLHVIERKKSIHLPNRPDGGDAGRFLVRAVADGFRWATIADLGGSRQDLIPALLIKEEEATSGAWRNQIEAEDWVFEIENKAITHRPDLWGHRGFAREIAAVLGVALAPEEQVCMSKPIRHFDRKSPTIDISKPSACTRFAGIGISNVSYTPSLLWMVSRLARVDARALNVFVDMGNYVMFDLGQPMHVFDAEAVRGGLLTARFANSGEKLQLIDGELIELTPEDTVIADAQGALSLAGIMGGRESGVSRSTKRLFLEGAHFEPGMIRKSALRHKKRSESSSRFEKNLDPNQNTLALGRYLMLLQDAAILCQVEESIVSVGPLAKEGEILLSHKFLVDRLGSTITEGQVRTILTRLGFGVQTVDGAQGLAYRVVVPTFRATKDIKIAEDLVEEVVRFYGYSQIVPSLPTRPMRPFSTEKVMLKRQLKHACAFALEMREIESYPLFDEEWVRELGFAPERAITLQNPGSENWRRLVTSLIPHLLRAISTNAVKADKLRFFELGQCWETKELNDFVEFSRCAGVVYRKKEADFYASKTLLMNLFDSLNLLVEWSKPTKDIPFWAAPYEVAELTIGGKIIGYAGFVSDALMAKVAEGRVFAFEWDTAFLSSKEQTMRSYEPLSRYQDVALDISVLLPRRITVAACEQAIALTDVRVRDVTLVDIFEKEEWGDRRSVTLRYVVQDAEKTLVGDEIDEVQRAVEGSLKELGGEIR